ncbi:MAG: diguanylate cyclase [Eubacterium sp.]|nr:diguanylate cyclase [Eubacterium sp.]
MKKILVIDDEKMILTNAEHILSSKYMVFTAQSAEEGMRLYEEEMPDLVLLDIRMPGMDGFDFQDALNEKYAKNIPIIFMTGDESREIEGIGLKRGAEDFIHKPFLPEVLLSRIEKSLGNLDVLRMLSEEMAMDSLTGFSNRSGIERKLRETCESETGVLMVLDLDNFHIINDRYGHSQGDQIISEFADLIRGSIRNGDDIGRLGGDKFVLFCKNMRDEMQINVIVDRLNNQLVDLTKHLLGEDMKVPLGVSVGAVFVPFQGTDYDMLYNKADKALHQIKQEGKHGYRIYTNPDLPDDKTDASVKEDMNRVTRILEEETVPHSTMLLGQESFGNVYRYMMRYMKRYQGKAYKFLVTVDVHEEMPTDAYTGLITQVEEILKKQLRNSDLMMQTKENQYFLLLPMIDEINVPGVIQRLKSAWEKTECRDLADLTFDTEVISWEELSSEAERKDPKEYIQ